ncbi:MAG: hypothetical protein HY686_04235 [Chloroflexi bacterium]|nr:hypothetical protein [Chloroflexota bacterium]
MSASRRQAWAYAEGVLARPRRGLPVTLRHGKAGVTLLHNRRVLTRCYPSGTGVKAAALVAQALGVELPPVGASVEAVVTTGVLFRAISLSSLDLRKPEVSPLVERLLEEAEFQRRRAGTPGVQ